MNRLKSLKVALTASVCFSAAIPAAYARQFDVPSGDLDAALALYTAQAGVSLAVPSDAVKGVRTKGAKGDFSPEVALARILRGTGFAAETDPAGVIRVMPQAAAAPSRVVTRRLSVAEAEPVHAASSVETVVVTSSKIKGDIQTVPIAITALSQEQLTSRQIAGGPDLVKEVPNLTFSKTNFTGYNLEIRGIGTQAISVATDPAVAVAFNDTPFIRNHFFEQEFFDVSQVEVLRGPQGTLYGRNATAGVVNVVSAKPTDQFEAMLSADWGNFHNRRYEGMVNIPIVGDKLALRIAGEWTKRDGYSFNETTGSPIDGRDLWSSRVTLGWKPASDIDTYFIWEHFQEKDDRLRSGKQLCKKDHPPEFIDGVPVPAEGTNTFAVTGSYFSQGCQPVSLYSPEAFQVVDGYSLPFISGDAYLGFIQGGVDPYASTVQSRNLRDIQSAINPRYVAKNDTLEYNATWNISPALALYSDTGYNNDFLWSTEDYNRFDTSPGIFRPNGSFIDDNGVFCDPQLGCSDRLVVQDLAAEHSWQLSQEFRLASNFSGPFNFSAGGNYLHYETSENYYVFSNTFTMISLSSEGSCARPYLPHEFDGYDCLFNGKSYNDPANGGGVPSESPQSIDPNPITSLNDKGHNYFLSDNPYVLNSYAAFGEAYFNVTPDLKLTAGLRWTEDEKHFLEIPSELLAQGYGYPETAPVNQNWGRATGRLVANWTPKLDFTDQSMFYASYAHGYKAGGANPPAAVLIDADVPKAANRVSVNIHFPVHPLTFKPEYIDAFELGTKNTLLDGGLTLNGDVFYYDYKGYQISQIVDRTSVNLNFDATVKGAELEATYEPVPGLKFSLAGGYEDTRLKDGQYAIDLMDRTAGTPGWVVMKPSVGQSSNCILPDYVAAAVITGFTHYGLGTPGVAACGYAYFGHLDPLTGLTYVQNPTPSAFSDMPPGYPGYDPLSDDPNAPANVNNGLGLPPNNGEGFAKPLGGNQLPNAPHFTLSLTGDYTIPVSANWAATLHSDFYWQSQSFARVFNDRPYDKIRGYSTTNVALILTDAAGWQVIGYVKNIFDVTAITGDFLNSDDSGLTTNVFLTDPRLYGLRVTKHFDGGELPWGNDILADSNGKRPQFWLEVGGMYNMHTGTAQKYVPPFVSLIPGDLPNGLAVEKSPPASFDWEGKLTYQPEDSDWKLVAGIRYGRSATRKHIHKSLAPPTKTALVIPSYGTIPCTALQAYLTITCPWRGAGGEFTDAESESRERHTILDFMLGRDVGIGTVSGGVRIAQFSSRSNTDINTDPDYNAGYFAYPKYHSIWNGMEQDKRRFRGIGPQLAWDASNPIFGDVRNGQIAVDWGINAAMLFGRQRANVHHKTTDDFCQSRTPKFCNFGTPAVYVYSTETTKNRSKNVTVPNFGGYVGLSARYSNAKISLGYRADEFFGAMDGGLDTAKRENRGFYGPYLNLSIGFGG